jgi:hypothetical protein
MLPVVVNPRSIQQEHMGLSTDPKPDHAHVGDIYLELDTELTYRWDGNAWIQETRGLLNRVYLWNTETWEWEASTKGSGVGQAVSVENFPAIMSGASIPITSDDPTSTYKITDIDPTDGNSYFGYVDKDGQWYIMNLTATTARYVKGTSGYEAAWGGRGGLNYDYFNNVF